MLIVALSRVARAPAHDEGPPMYGKETLCQSDYSLLPEGFVGRPASSCKGERVKTGQESSAPEAKGDLIADDAAPHPAGSRNTTTKAAKARCKNTQLQRSDGLPSSATFGDVITMDHQTLNEDTESRAQHRKIVIVQDIFSFWLQSDPVEGRMSCLTVRFSQCFIYFSDALGRFTQRILWSSSRLVTNSCGVVTLPLLITLKPMASLRELFVESRKARLLLWCSVVLLMNGGVKPWTVIVICRTFMTHQLIVKQQTNKDIVHPLMVHCDLLGQIFRNLESIC